MKCDTVRDCGKDTFCARRGSKLVCTADGGCACTLPRMNWGTVAAWCAVAVLVTWASASECRGRKSVPR